MWEKKIQGVSSSIIGIHPLLDDNYLICSAFNSKVRPFCKPTYTCMQSHACGKIHARCWLKINITVFAKPLVHCALAIVNYYWPPSAVSMYRVVM